MLGCLYEFGQGEIDAEVAEKLALRLKFDEMCIRDSLHAWRRRPKL